jgi:hypothetical protein
VDGVWRREVFCFVVEMELEKLQTHAEGL